MQTDKIESWIKQEAEKYFGASGDRYQRQSFYDGAKKMQSRLQSEVDRLKEEVVDRNNYYENKIEMLMRTADEREGYWRRRCEAAEAYIDTCVVQSHDSYSKPFFDNWQQLKTP